MTFEEAFDNAVRAFYAGKEMTETERVSGSPMKYNKKFFDDFEQEIRPKKTKEKIKPEDLEIEEDD